MTSDVAQPIRIAAALITDREGRLLLVRKTGTRWFMQAGGKIEPTEDALSALRRELIEEIGVTFDTGQVRHLGRFDAPAANEIGRMVEAELFHLHLGTAPSPASEIEEAIWITPEAAEGLPLAPLTRHHVLPLARAMRAPSEKTKSKGLPKVLISACLMGRPVRYNGSAKPLTHSLLDWLETQGRLVTICPELSAGFSVPRPPAEIADGQDGQAVLQGAARVVEATGRDVTALYVAGAQAALALARETDCRFALLIDGSPSCGSTTIYNGSFGGQTHSGAGVTAALLRQHGIEVFADTEIEALEIRLRQHGERIRL